MTGTHSLLLAGRTQLWDSNHLPADQRRINAYCQPDNPGENVTICWSLFLTKTSAHKNCPKIYGTIFQKFPNMSSTREDKEVKSFTLKYQRSSTFLFRMPMAHWAADLEFTSTPRKKSPGRRWPQFVCNSNKNIAMFVQNVLATNN